MSEEIKEVTKEGFELDGECKEGGKHDVSYLPHGVMRKKKPYCNNCFRWLK